MPAYPAEAAARERQLARPFSPPVPVELRKRHPPGRVRGRQVALPYPGTSDNVAPSGRRAVRRGAARRNTGNLLNSRAELRGIRTIRQLATAPEWLTWPATGSVSGGSTPAEVSMSRTGRNDEPGTKASSPWHRARQAAAQVKPAAAQLTPLARSTAGAARRRVRKTRAWAAPQVEHAGQVLQDSVAPRVSALLSAAARRLEPAKPRRRRWRKPAGVAMLAAAASAVAAVVRNRRKPEVTTPAAEAETDGATP